MYVPLNPIPLKDRVSLIFLQYGQIDVIDGAFVLVDKTGVRTHIPVGSVACIMLGGYTGFSCCGAAGGNGRYTAGVGR